MILVPGHVFELVSIRKSPRKLASSSHKLLQVRVSRLKSYGDYAFSVAAPTLWNRVPADIRNASSLEKFKSVLKTNLVKVAFTDNLFLFFKSLIGFIQTYYLGYYYITYYLYSAFEWRLLVMALYYIYSIIIIN